MQKTKERKNYLVLGFPSVGAGAELRYVSLEEHLKYTLRAAILTQLGERPLFPSIGSEVRNLLFRPLLSSLKTELQGAIRTAILEAEPRVEVETVSVDEDNTDRSRWLVSVDYRIQQTRKRDQVRLSLQ